jgi:hypothetical protein
MLIRSLAALCVAALLCVGIAPAAQRARAANVQSLCSGALRNVADKTHAKINACIAPQGRFILQTTYYQNASKVGGTALAAYPEATLRYGLTENVELYMDVPSDIAKSGQRGAGVFYFTHPGFGVKVRLAHAMRSAYAISFETRPPLDAMAHLSLLPQAEAALTGDWRLTSRWSVQAQAGALRFRQRGMPGDEQTAAIFSAAANYDLSKRTTVAVQLRSLSAAAIRSSAQSMGTLGIVQELNDRAIFRVELGTAFNAAGHTKAHYLGAGFTIR